jgi:hypothetical protein
MADVLEIAPNNTTLPLLPLPGAAQLVHILGTGDGKKLAAQEYRDSNCGGSNSAVPATLDEDESAE